MYWFRIWEQVAPVCANPVPAAAFCCSTFTRYAPSAFSSRCAASSSAAPAVSVWARASASRFTRVAPSPRGGCVIIVLTLACCAAELLRAMSRAERESLVSLRLWLVSRSARSAPLIASPKPAAEAETVAPRCS